MLMLKPILRLFLSITSVARRTPRLAFEKIIVVSAFTEPNPIGSPLFGRESNESIHILQLISTVRYYVLCSIKDYSVETLPASEPLSYDSITFGSQNAKRTLTKCKLYSSEAVAAVAAAAKSRS